MRSLNSGIESTHKSNNLNNSKEQINRGDSKLLKKIYTFCLRLFAIGGLIFLVLPILIVIPMSFSGASDLQFPPGEFSLRWYEAFFGDPAWMAAVKTSLIVSSIASLLALTLGCLAVYGLTRFVTRHQDLIMLQFLAPMIVPSIIVAVALYIAFAYIGILGTLLGLIIAHTILITPFVVTVLYPVFSSFDYRIELAARSLGATWIVAFFRVILPNLAPSIMGAWFIAFIISFDELIVTLFLSSGYMTVPKKMYNDLLTHIDPTITAVSTILICITGLVMIGIALLLRRQENVNEVLKLDE